MRSPPRLVQYDTIPDLLSAAKEMAKEEHRYQDRFKLIVTSAFGTASGKGLIPERIQYYFQKTPINWAEELDAISKVFSPGGEILSGQGGLMATADYTIQIDPKILPRAVMDEFVAQGDRHSTMLHSLKRELGEQYFINSWEWFWANVASALVNQPEIDEKRSSQDDQNEDELFYMMSRNPYLIIIRRALQHNYRRQSNLLDRLRGVLELYIMQELLFATRQKGRSMQKYQLRAHYLGMVFLLIHSRRNKFSAETMEIYLEYFHKATEYYSTISSYSNSQKIRNIIRVWMYLLAREHSLDGNIVQKLQNANPRDGWYRLARCPIQKWSENIKKVDFFSHQLPAIISVRKNIYRLLSKNSEWTPSFSILATLEQFLEFDQLVLQKYIKRQGQREEDETITKCLERTLVHLAQNGANSQFLEKHQETLNTKYKNRLGKKLSINFGERSEQAKQKLSRTSRERSQSISYQNPRIRNVWQHPLQQNEYYILFTGAFWVSKQLDKLVPGHSKRTYPCINIRIFSNPFVFLITVIIVMIAARWVF